jgi:hypothetical protein
MKVPADRSDLEGGMTGHAFEEQSQPSGALRKPFRVTLSRRTRKIALA